MVRKRKSFFREHSLGLVTAGILVAWIVLYSVSDEKTRFGAFFGNATADFSGLLVSVLATKYFFEIGSAESRQPPHKYLAWVPEFLLDHSLTIFIVITGMAWLILFLRVDPNGKWGQVVGNLVSEWAQLFGVVWLTKELTERGSKESKR